MANPVTNPILERSFSFVKSPLNPQSKFPLVILLPNRIPLWAPA